MCLKFSPDRKTWLQAKAECESDGARLVKIDTEDKMRDVSYILVADHIGKFFIGARNHNGSWEWTDGSVVKQQWWLFRDEPSDYSHRDCLVARSDFADWHNIPCRRLRRYICEKL
ncbi:C-type lectin-like [Gigantopelta aegis]|uniref:C-type lectin-like n=1 Tax=Gigantopelta aegis TaxID=1735272 RepID=UPI001B88B485|nr:C-type lectin-like [Gigantopelta aegis]